jgi:hypothetical protein
MTSTCSRSVPYGAGAISVTSRKSYLFFFIFKLYLNYITGRQQNYFCAAFGFGGINMLI